MQYLFTILNGPARGRRFAVDASRAIILGRGDDADVQLTDDEYVSWHHVQIALRHTGPWLTEFGTEGKRPTNTPHVNSVAATDVELHDGDVIELGYTQCRINFTSDNDHVTVACTGCGEDLTQKANSDGRLAEFKELMYVCPRHLPVGDEHGGRELGGFNIRRLLGTGGMGNVYLAYDQSTCRLLALKQVKLKTSEVMRRAYREVLLLSRFRHENIVRLVDSDLDESGGPLLVTEYVPDGDIEQLAARHNGIVPERLVVEIGLGLLEGLKHLHAQAGVHRDVKPQNVLLKRLSSSKGEHFVAKLADFGLAKCYQVAGARITRPGQAGGSLGFMAPEQITNFETLSEAADVYSAGATLFYALTSRSPLRVQENASEDEQLASVLYAPRMAIRTFAPEISPLLANVIDQACQLDPERRFRNAAEFQSALRSAF